MTHSPCALSSFPHSLPPHHSFSTLSPHISSPNHTSLILPLLTHISITPLPEPHALLTTTTTSRSTSMASHSPHPRPPLPPSTHSSSISPSPSMTLDSASPHPPSWSVHSHSASHAALPSPLVLSTPIMPATHHTALPLFPPHLSLHLKLIPP